MIAPVTVRGSGYVKILSPGWPLAIGDLAPGASRTVRVVLDVPATVREFMLLEAGVFRISGGRLVAFTDSQTFTR